ncbi:MAG TPA: hypothetical protein PKH77_25880, partial [Anaerolineae bacterium]|nr:hypothetical protein [Anaerolineae bacterium]
PRLPSTVYRLLLAFLLAFLLTAWFWAPAILETKYGQMGEEFTAGYFHYSNHFRGWNLVQPSLAFDYSVAIRTEDAGPFAMGLVQAALAGVGAVVLGLQIANRKLRITNYELRITNPPLSPSPPLPLVCFILFGLFLSTFMITPLSKPLWDYLPLLEMTQFPWRFLSIQALFTAIVSGEVGVRSEELGNKRQEARSKRQEARFTFYVLRITHYALLLLVLVSSLFSLRPDRLLIDDADVTWENLLFYETFTGNIGTTIRYEYLPRDVNPRLYISESVIDGQGRAIADGDARLEATMRQRAPNRQVWQVTLDQAAPVTFPLNWWPGWQAEVDDAHTDTYAMPGSGRLTVNLPAGAHTVVLRLGNTPLRMVANLVSILTTVGVIAYCVVRQTSNAIRNSQFAIRNSLFAICLFAVCLLLPLSLHGKPLNSATFFDFHRSPYPHAGPVDWGWVRLESVTLSAEVVQPGEVLTVTHVWAGGGAPITGTVRLVSPAEARHGVVVTLAEAPFMTQQGAGTAPLRLPDDLSRGLYWVELRVGTGEAVYVGAVRVLHGPARRMDAPVLAEFRDVTLHTAEVSQPDATTLRVKLAWSTAGTPRNWSLSLRVLYAAGRQVAQQDQEAHGYGYLPTTLWLPGELVTDYAVLSLPEGLAPGDYTLRVITYLRATGEGGGQADIPISLTTPTRYDLAEHPDATILCEADGVALVGVELPDALHEGQPLDFHAQWNAMITPTADLVATWALISPEGMPVTSATGPLSAGSRPATWPPQTWVRAPVHLELPPTLPTGEYRLRVALTGDDGVETPCDLPRPLPLIPRPRLYTASDIAHEQTAAFGDGLRLLGYDWTEERDKLTLTLWWQATAAPGRDYKRFIHVYDPATEAIVAQDDAMPRAWTYPTSLWAAGEVVSETVMLDLSAAPQDRYRVAVGWYDPETVTRLPARDAEGQPVQLDRILLDIKVSHF